MNDSATIDSLTIDIDSSAGSSAKGIEEFTNKLKSLYTSVQQNLTALGKLNSALKNIQNTTKNMKTINIKTTTNVGGLTSVGNVPMANNVNANIRAMKSLNKEAITLNKNLLTANRRKLDIVPKDVKKDFSNINKNVENVSNSIVDTSKGNTSDFKKITGDVGDLSKSFNEVSNSVGKASQILHAFIEACKVSAKVGEKVGNAIATGITTPINYLKKEMTFGLVPANKGLVTSFRQMLLALVGVRGLFTATRKAISEYMAYDDELSESLRNNWAIIGSVVSPVIEKLVDLMGTLASYIATLIKTFFGVDIVARANQKMLNKTASSATGTAKAVKGLNDELGNLADFDKLHVINFPKETDTNSGKSSGTNIKPLTLGKADTSWIETLKRYIDVDDYFKLGVDIATKFEEGLKSIPWDNIQSKLIKYTTNIVDLLNGFTAKIDGKLIGRTIGEVYNTVLYTLDTFFANYRFDWLGRDIKNGIDGAIESIDWEATGRYLGHKIMSIIHISYEIFDPRTWYNLGTSIGKTIMSWFETIDWKKAGQTISRGIISIHKLVEGMFKNLDGKKMAEDFNNFVKGFDWAGVGKSIHDSFIAIFDTLGDFLDNVDTDSLNKGIEEFVENLKWEEISSKMFSVAWKAIKIAFGAFWSIQKARTKERFNNIGSGIIGWFKEGILKNSPLGAIITVVDNVKKWFQEKLGLKDGEEGSSESEPWGKKLVDGIGEGFKKSPIVTAITNITDTVKNNFKNLFGINGDSSTEGETIGTKFINGIKNGLKENPLVQKFNEIKNKLFSKTDETGEKAGNVFGNALKRVLNAILSSIENIMNGGIRAVNKAIYAFKQIPLLNKIPVNYVSEVQLPRIALATGTNRIISEGIYHLHKDEAVVPKKYNPAVNNKLYEENNQEIVSELHQMRKDIQNLTFTNVVKIGEDDIYKKQNVYNERRKQIYGTS